ncbi:MAG: aminoglycoside phosphotransferase family protein [Ruminococcus flavefaciens]|nr:aminoglycoside phosphotransferase family protein [Ruminococcus flavefaciens]MCM1230437.1 aminoglycoside phosphotransferase family protein [Ruminococcus flavefaciens]
MNNIKDITVKFGIADVVSLTELKKGHTNTTYRLECGSGKYILQSLNRDIFKNPEIVMSNISLIEKAFESEKSLVIPHYLSCGDRNYTEQDGRLWRICRYIENIPNTVNRNYLHGYAVGRFLRVVNSGGFEFENPIDLHNFGLNLPLRNIHGDTKLDNIIFGRKPAIIDFDTAMHGYICADYGDMIRSATTEAFSLPLIREITKGFASGLCGMLTAEEIASLYDGIVLITSELLERYRQGNRNFPNKTPEQCLERENQLTRQLGEFRSHKDETVNIINSCFE